jgi:hypothetical protein
MVQYKSNFAQIGLDNAYGQPCVYIYVQRSPVEIKNPTRWNLIGRSMIVSPPVLSPSSILPPSSSPALLFPQGKIWGFY